MQRSFARKGRVVVNNNLTMIRDFFLDGAQPLDDHENEDLTKMKRSVARKDRAIGLP